MPSQKTLHWEENFRRLSDFLFHEWQQGWNCLRDYLQPVKAGTKSRDFLRDGAYLVLARLLDRHKNAVSIYTFLDFAANHPHIFKNFLPSGGYSLPDRVKKRKEELNRNETAISLVREVRDRVYAHNDPRFLDEAERTQLWEKMNGLPIADLYTLTLSILEEFIGYFGHELPLSKI